MALSLLCAVRLWSTPAALCRRRVLWATATAAACSCALSCKMTALPTILVIGLECLLGLTFAQTPLMISTILWMAVVGAAGYVAVFVPHFQLMPKTGDGDGFMSFEFQQGLVGSPLHDPEEPKMSFPRAFLELNLEMVRCNAAIATRHNAESRWYTWPVNLKGFFYDSGGHTEGSDVYERIYLLGNPIVLWAALALVVGSFVGLLVVQRYRVRHPHVKVAVFLLLGWIINLLPYILVERTTWLYHYIPSLYFAQLLFAFAYDLVAGPAAVDRDALVKGAREGAREGAAAERPVVRAAEGIAAVRTSESSRWRRGIVVLAVSGAMGASFVYFAPWTYSLPVSSLRHKNMQWLTSWEVV